MLFMPGALLSFDEASSMVAECAVRLSMRMPAREFVPLAHAAGRVLAHPLPADSDQPRFTRSTRDGFACRAAEASSHVFLSLAGSVRAGDAPAPSLAAGSAYEIMTGAAVPEGADAVAMLEHVEVARIGVEGKVRLLPPRTLVPGENLVIRGAQARAGDELLPDGTRISAAQIALAASCGHSSLEVFVRPRVAILTTGDELVPVDAMPGPGQIRNSNAPMLAALVEAAGGEPWVLPKAADNADSLDRALGQAIDIAAGADMLLISGGVSAGKFDLVEPALERLGGRFHFTGVRIQPGKPLVFGELPIPAASADQTERGTKYCFGLPGNPVSTAVTFLLFAAPVLAALAGNRVHGPRFALAQLTMDASRSVKPGLTRFMPATCTFASVENKLPRVAQIPMQDSGDLAAFALSNCFLVIPDHDADLEEGAIVRILLA
jgi:molybdopterin molybdotransferase